MMQHPISLTRLHAILQGVVFGLICCVLILPVVSTDAKAENLLKREYKNAAPVAEAVGRAMAVGAQRVGVDGVRPSGPQSFPAPDPIIRKHDMQFAGAYINAIEKFGNDPSQRRMTGAVMHSDDLTRALYTRFEAEYRVRADGTLVLENAQLDPFYLEHPRVAMFFVPSETVNISSFESLGGKEQLKYVINRAVKVEGPGKASSRPRPYFVFAYVMDRLTEDVRLELAMSRSALGTAGFKNKCVHLQESGWHMAYAPARFGLDGGLELFFKVLKTSPQHSQPVLLNVFSSFSLVKRTQIALQNRGYSPGPSNGILNPPTRRAIAKFQREYQLEVDGNPSLALLLLLRGPTGLSPVKLTQQHLTDLGYRPGPVDGLMGRRTRSVIRAFQKDMGLKNNGKLPAELVPILLTTRANAAVQTARPQTSENQIRGANGSKFEAYRSKYWLNESR